MTPFAIRGAPAHSDIYAENLISDTCNACAPPITPTTPTPFPI